MSETPSDPDDLGDDLGDDAELRLTEQLVRRARPAVDPTTRDRLLFEAGRAAALRGRWRSTAAWATAACLFAATTAGLLVSRAGDPVVNAPSLVERNPIGPAAGNENPIVAARRDMPRPVPEAVTGEPRTLRAGDRGLHAIPPVFDGPLVASPNDQPPPLTPIQAWRGFDSI